MVRVRVISSDDGRPASFINRGSVKWTKLSIKTDDVQGAPVGHAVTH